MVAKVKNVFGMVSVVFGLGITARIVLKKTRIMCEKIVEIVTGIKIA
jgi:hypothetical protein